MTCCDPIGARACARRSAATLQATATVRRIATPARARMRRTSGASRDLRRRSPTAAPLDALLAALRAHEARRASSMPAQLARALQAIGRRRQLDADAVRVRSSRDTGDGAAARTNRRRRAQMLRTAARRRLVVHAGRGRTRLRDSRVRGALDRSCFRVVIGFHRLVWRPQRDSNPCFGLERATSWASGRWGPGRR